jgi:hypothetical protein
MTDGARRRSLPTRSNARRVSFISSWRTLSTAMGVAGVSRSTCWPAAWSALARARRLSVVGMGGGRRFQRWSKGEHPAVQCERRQL